MEGRDREKRDIDVRGGRKSKKGQTSGLKMESQKTRGGLGGENEIREVEKSREEEVGKV